MVFTNLGENEKDAFFNLLDEYFASRPEIFGNADEQTSVKTSAARALASNPEVATNLFSAGLRKTGSPFSTAASSPDISDAAPPSLPRRGTADSPPPSTTPSTTSSLKSVRKFGSDVDTTSAKGMFSSLRSSTAKKGQVQPPPMVPSAFAARKNAFAPPPSRTAASPAQEEPEPEPEPEEEAQGEWAEALYDYDSADPGDLQIRANQNVWVTERTSDDWWTGEFQGKTGLFPASYVKIL
ncbi:SH3-domain-containing protein [Roridomyces roridus]|uniref:SH3-domain-containing protein n=1 Tax=Roridomyces roridus TaxID=1738132 RepID=A0AAD7FUT0_9AGAR|nr:SH3-domain-containing protein [Roridomyces roridus]